MITFDDEARAQEFLMAMTRLASQGKLSLQDAVFVSKDDHGKVHVHETADLTVGEGALSGAFWGLLFGTLLLGPVGGLAVGAASSGAGALMGKIIDAGVEDDFVAEMKQAVEPGRTGVILLTEGGDVASLETELERFAGAHLIYSNLPAEARQAVEHALGEGDGADGVEVHPATGGA